jgi:hypothetical protein
MLHCASTTYSRHKYHTCVRPIATWQANLCLFQRVRLSSHIRVCIHAYVHQGKSSKEHYQPPKRSVMERTCIVLGLVASGLLGLFPLHFTFSPEHQHDYNRSDHRPHHQRTQKRESQSKHWMPSHRSLLHARGEFTCVCVARPHATSACVICIVGHSQPFKRLLTSHADVRDQP